MKFAYIIMGNFDSKKDRNSIKGDVAQIVGVSSIEDACKVAIELYEDGIDCIELCGAFGEEGARKVMEATQNKLPIGYVAKLPEQAKLYKELFGE